MKKTKAELLKECDEKICFLEKMIQNALAEPLESSMRNEYSFSIASTLRSIVCYDKTDLSLFYRCGLSEKVLFQLISPLEPLNVCGRSFKLISYTITSETVRVSSLDSVRDERGLYGAMLSFKTWLNEIVVDPMMPKVNPLSRYSIIKIVADKYGAHVDTKKDDNVVEMSKEDIYLLRIPGETKDREIQAKNLLSETIITIGMEVVFSYKYLKQTSLTAIGPSDFECYIQDYGSGVKVLAIPGGTGLNPYNSNSHHNCSLSKIATSAYKIRFDGRLYFPITIINA